jgi:hypothetical protein
MAKKKSASGFNMAAEIRGLLEENRDLSGKDVYTALKKKFPRKGINESSCGVAFSGARKKLGITQPRRGKKRKTAVVKLKPAAAALKVNLNALQAAAKFVSEVGDADKAIAAIRQLRSLQIQ